MKQNVGSKDRMIRFLAGLVMLILGVISGMSIFDSFALKSVTVFIGLVLIATALMNFCPLYRLIGVNTR